MNETPQTEQTPVESCSFCHAPSTGTGMLVAGEGAQICDRCVALCLMIIAVRPSTTPRLAVWNQVDDLDRLLLSLPGVVSAGTMVQHSLRGWVQRGRALGATWDEIGRALGISRQSAWERFSPNV